jgi:hypothetical protein
MDNARPKNKSSLASKVTRKAAKYELQLPSKLQTSSLVFKLLQHGVTFFLLDME